MLDPRTPVIIGAGQLSNVDHSVEPIDQMARAIETAVADTGAADVLSAVQSVRVLQGIWPYKDPGRLVVDQLAMPAVTETLITHIGGDVAYKLVAQTAAELRDGKLDAAVVCSAETLRTRRRDRREGRSSSYLDEADGAAPDTDFGQSGPMDDPRTLRKGPGEVVNFYAMVETSLRHRHEETPDQHLERISKLWASAAEVAATNPYATLRSRPSAAEIATPSGANRQITSPYPKLMTSNLDVDQAAAVIMCTAETAMSHGVPRDRWVFPWVSTSANEPFDIDHRRQLDTSVAMGAAGRLAVEMAGGIDDIDRLDLYSCFPAAVQVAQREVGIDHERGFTITGGLTFAGGPMNSYCVHSLERSVAMLRNGEARTYLLSGNGGYFDKHSFLFLGDRPPSEPFESARAQVDVDSTDGRPSADRGAPSGIIETYTVGYSRDGGLDRAILSVIDGAGARVWAYTDDPAAMKALENDDCCGADTGLDWTDDLPSAVVDL